MVPEKAYLPSVFAKIQTGSCAVNCTRTVGAARRSAVPASGSSIRSPCGITGFSSVLAGILAGSVGTGGGGFGVWTTAATERRGRCDHEYTAEQTSTTTTTKAR